MVLLLFLCFCLFCFCFALALHNFLFNCHQKKKNLRKMSTVYLSPNHTSCSYMTPCGDMHVSACYRAPHSSEHRTVKNKGMFLQQRNLLLPTSGGGLSAHVRRKLMYVEICPTSYLLANISLLHNFNFRTNLRVSF